MGGKNLSHLLKTKKQVNFLKKVVDFQKVLYYNTTCVKRRTPDIPERGVAQLG